MFDYRGMGAVDRDVEQELFLLLKLDHPLLDGVLAAETNTRHLKKTHAHTHKKTIGDDHDLKRYVRET
jgi:hypothetical protein